MTETTEPRLLSERAALAEAERCLYCFDAPCTDSCPAHIDIPGFIAMIRTRNHTGASKIVKESNILANTCGAVCPEEIYCQSVCNRAKEDAPVAIRELHMFATRFESRYGLMEPLPVEPNGKRVAVVGAGPSGIGCAFELYKLGYQVAVFDHRVAGGVPRHSIPPFRLRGEALEQDIEFISRFVTFKREFVTPNKLLTLQKTFDAVFLGIGLGKDNAAGLSGEQLDGCYGALEFLEAAKERWKSVRVGSSVVVIGGGNVSLDCASTAKALGADRVTLLYRRGPREMKVWKSELAEAQERGVEISYLTSPVAIEGKSRVTGVHCRRNVLSASRDSSGRRRPEEVDGSDFVLKADTVIVAIGQSVSSPLAARLRKHGSGALSGYVVVDRNGMTSDPGLFSGGDAVSGEGTIVLSLAQGKSAAMGIHKYLAASPKKRRVPVSPLGGKGATRSAR